MKKYLQRRRRQGIRVPLARTPTSRHPHKHHGKNFHSFITTLSPIEPIGQRALTDDILDTLAAHQHENSPFKQCPMLHMLRLQVMDSLWPALGDTSSEGLKTRYLLLIADVDGDPADFYDCLYREAADFVQDVWGKCIGYPDYQGPVFFRRYMKRCALETQLPYAAFPDSVNDIHYALDTQGQLINWLDDKQRPGNDLLDQWNILMSEIDQREQPSADNTVLNR